MPATRSPKPAGLSSTVAGSRRQRRDVHRQRQGFRRPRQGRRRQEGTFADAGESSACTGGTSAGVPGGGQGEAGAFFPSENATASRVGRCPILGGVLRDLLNFVAQLSPKLPNLVRLPPGYDPSPLASAPPTPQIVSCSVLSMSMRLRCLFCSFPLR